MRAHADKLEARSKVFGDPDHPKWLLTIAKKHAEARQPKRKRSNTGNASKSARLGKAPVVVKLRR
jgi:hypothetical protein